jgi:hypothetical protein
MANLGTTTHVGKDTPSSLRIYSHTLACHPFPLRAKGKKKLNAKFPFAVGKGVPNLDGEAWYPSGYVRNNAVVTPPPPTNKTKISPPPPIARMPYNTP